MTDFLMVSFDKDEKTNEVGICVVRQTKAKTNVLKMELDEQAELLYRALIDQDFKITELKGENKLTCDRNICLKNEYSNIGCEDCVVTKGETGE